MRLFIVVSLFVGLFGLSACFMGNKVSTAQKAFEIGEYQRAADQFKRAYSRERNRYTKGELAFYMGECYRKTNLPHKAASAYSKSVRYKYEQRIGELYMAESYRKRGDYEKALEAYESYREKVPGDLRVINGVKSCKMAMADNGPQRYQVEKVKAFSSKFSDFSPVYSGSDYDLVYFTSMRTEKKKRKRNRITGQGGADIYMARLDAKGEWTDPEALDEAINSSFDEGASSMAADGKQMFFTRCRYDKEQPTDAEIYQIDRSGGRWSEPVLVTLGVDSVMMAHPAISPDGSALYFVSDMPGGLGGKDIWKCENSGGQWSVPVNLGPGINTPGDEVFPYVRNNGTLYFSSDTHVGYGGLDIFMANPVEEEQGSTWQIVNMGRPINSASDDFGIVFKGKGEEGLFSSSRGSSRAVDNIYSFVLPKLEFDMMGQVVSQKTGEPVEDAYLRVIGTDGTNTKIGMPEDGRFELDLQPESEYVLLVAAKGHFNHKEKIVTSGLAGNKTFELKVDLMPMEKSIVLNNVYFEAGGFDLQGDTRKELERLLQIMLDNPTLRIQLGAHTDDLGDETENLVLSQIRAEAVMQFLIDGGVPPENVSAKGHGEEQPVVVDKNMASRYKFLREGDVLSSDFINSLRRGNQADARKINRRIEFTVLDK
jgi:peptidoglycan-associated lipoprotein